MERRKEAAACKSSDEDAWIVHSAAFECSSVNTEDISFEDIF